ncbi:MAG: vacuolar sorting protein VPS33/slp1, partial [Watsoniomyces obsoletus]
RLIVFMAGGATYAESRACYEVSHMMGREVFLATSHMITPKSYLRQVGLLSSGRKQLELPQDSAPPQVPAWMNDAPPASQQPSRPQQEANGRPPDASRPPTDAMRNMNLGPNTRPQNGGPPSRDPRAPSPQPGRSPARPPPSQHAVSTFRPPEDDDRSGKLRKDKKDKKHLGLFKKH